MPKYKQRLDEKAYVEVRESLIDYILVTDDPTIPEFLSTDVAATKHWVTEEELLSPAYPEFKPLIERLYKKSEAYMLRKGMNGQSTAMSIFRLKQKWHGYRDKIEQDITTDGEKVTFVNAVTRPPKSAAGRKIVENKEA